MEVGSDGCLERLVLAKGKKIDPIASIRASKNGTRITRIYPVSARQAYSRRILILINGKTPQSGLVLHQNLAELITKN